MKNLKRKREGQKMAKKINNLEDLLVDQLKDLYSAENQLVKALPKMAKAANSQDLKKGFEKHLEETKRQAERIEQIFDKHGLSGSPKGKKCVGMEGLIKEGEEILKENIDPDALDAGLIAAAQKVEHYEIASYGTARTYAKTLGYTEAARLLQQTLDEESKTNEKLTALAESHINIEAASG
jgi:ferritin-like metal-binding protein YciE